MGKKLERYRKLNYKLDKNILQQYVTQLDRPNYEYQDIKMYYTLAEQKYEYINKFVKSLPDILDCITTRECFTIQEKGNTDLKVHIDRCDKTDLDKEHKDYYSMVIPVSGLGYTSFYEYDGSEFDFIEQKQEYILEHGQKFKRVDRIQIVDNPVIIDISHPHSVEVLEYPRITYQLKLSKVKYNIQTIQEKIDEHWNIS